MTQMQYALDGIITKEMMQVAKNEDLAPEWICSEVAAGRITIPKNINHNFDVQKLMQISVHPKNIVIPKKKFVN